MPEYRIWHVLLWSFLWLPLVARSEMEPPPAAFWEYLAEFDDQNGDVFDPLDLTDAEKIVRSETAATTNTELNIQPQEESQP